jgi:hypothetical protein
VESITRLRGRIFDVLVIVVAVAAELEIVLRDLPGPRWLLLSAGLLYTLPLLLRQRWPFVAPVFVICVQVLASFLDVPGGSRESWGVVAYVLAFWALGAYNALGKAIVGLVTGLVGVVLVTVEGRARGRERVVQRGTGGLPDLVGRRGAAPAHGAGRSG